MLKEREIQKIRYTKDVGGSGELNRVEVTERTIIPTFVPKMNVKALDVTDLTEDQQAELQQLMREYGEYVELQTNRIFKFEDWVSHTHGKEPEVKWRTFKLASTEILD